MAKNDENEKTLNKNKKVKASFEKDKKVLEKYLLQIDDSKKYIASALLDDIVFMKYSLKDLREIIMEVGFTETYKNGNEQFGTKVSSASQSYNALLKSYTTTIKQFLACFDSEQQKTITADDEFASFMTKSKSIKR